MEKKGKKGGFFLFGKSLLKVTSRENMGKVMHNHTFIAFSLQNT